MKNLNSVLLSGKEVLPIVEGGKGVGITTGVTAGSFAASGAIGTFSGVNAQIIDEHGTPLRAEYHTHTRKDRHAELIEMGIKGALSQAKVAREISGSNGAIHMNVLWEMGGAEQILEGVLEQSKGLIDGITCGAGMPYKLADFAVKYNVYYYPIISSMRAFRALWKRSYHRHPELLGAIVYEDPWLAGGHNGLSNSENPQFPEDPYPRIVEIRKFMNEVGLHTTPIIMAGGVWHLRDFAHWLDNKEIGPVAFQFGTRPILTQEYPVSDAWKKRLMTLKEGDVFLNRFSPTGFYSSAVNNEFIKELRGRSERQIEYRTQPDETYSKDLPLGPRGRPVYVQPEDFTKAHSWIAAGFDEQLKTPDSSIIFVTKAKADEIISDQINCMGCLSFCRFSNWSDKADLNYNTGKKADPRSFCIQKTLQEVAYGEDVEHQLMFSGHNAFKFQADPYYANGFVPTIRQLVERIMTGD